MAKRGRPKHTGILKGALNTQFHTALKEINLEVIRFMKAGYRTYFTKYDANHAFRKYKGLCAYCSLSLLPRGNTYNSVRLMMHIPMKSGGEVIRENLIPVCTWCRKTQRPSPKRSVGRIEDYNTIPDIIEQLVKAVMINSETVKPLKKELNLAVEEFVATLQYAPSYEMKKEVLVAIKEEENTVSDSVEKLAKGEEAKEELSDTLKHITVTHQYRILRDGNNT